MALKLYGTPTSTCAARVMTVLNEKLVDFELRPVDLFAGEHRKPDFLSKNPFGYVPVLEDGDLTLFAYLSEKYKDRGYDLIRHGNPREAAFTKMWMEVEAHHFNPTVHPIIFETFVAPIFGDGRPSDQSIIKANVDKLGKVLDIYESRLSTTKYLAGDFFSLADMHHLPYTHYLMQTTFSKLVTSRPHLKAWWEDTSLRPSFKKVSPGMNFPTPN
ncbi:hypothetical protein Ancab_019459 [Ancistrocladus abbreviatus]